MHDRIGKKNSSFVTILKKFNVVNVSLGRIPFKHLNVFLVALNLNAFEHSILTNIKK